MSKELSLTDALARIETLERDVQILSDLVDALTHRCGAVGKPKVATPSERGARFMRRNARQ